MKQPATAPAQSLAQKIASPAWYKQHWFVWATLLAFALQAVWLAWHSAYPMAFDEGYHLQIIQFFSTRLNPIITQQDPQHVWTWEPRTKHILVVSLPDELRVPAACPERLTTN